MEFIKRYLGKMVIRSRSSLIDVEFFEFVAHDGGDLETDCSLDGFAQCLCANLPFGSKPASGALHPHAELRQARSVWGNYRWPEGARESVVSNAGSVVPDSDSARP
jgi:hypothetical protein